MKIPPACMITLVFSAALFSGSAARAIWIVGDLPGAGITVKVSSQFGADQGARHLIDGAGLRGELHDNDASAQSMWHTDGHSPATAAAQGLPTAPAWVRFDFAQPERFDSIAIWNHNQADLTDRGFRRTRIFGTADGAQWVSLTSSEIIEI